MPARPYPLASGVTRVLCLAVGVLLLVSAVAPAQVVVPPGYGPRTVPPDQQQPAPEPAKPPLPPPTQPPAQTPEAKPSGETPTQAARPAQATTASGGFAFNFQNANLIEVIDILARQLKLNYILDPRVKGSVNINTYGEMREVDLRALLETILRINNAAMIQVGNIHRIVPINEAARLPITAQPTREVPYDDERMVLNLIFLQYVTVAELSKLLTPFLGEGATMVSYEPANMLLLLDNARNMRRTMGLIEAFDSDTFVNQRVRLYELKHARPGDVADELDKLFRTISLSEKASGVRFLAVDRINTLIVVSSNPGTFEQVEQWLDKLDVVVQSASGSMNNYVYRVKYGRAELLAMSISQLYGYPTMGGFGMGGFGMGMMGGRRGGGGGGRMGAMGAGMGSMGMNAMGGYGMGGYNMGGMGMGYPMGGMSMPSYGAMPYGAIVAASPGGLGTTTAGTGTAGSATTTTTTTMPGSQNLTGMYLGAAGGYGMYPPGVPRIVPNPMDNTLLIQATPQDYEQIANLLYQLDIPPRQVLIEAKIYEVSLTGSFAGGVAAALRSRGAASGTNDPISGATRLATGDVGVGGLRLTAGLLVGQSRELLGVLTAQEDTRRARLISAPVVVATDSIPAMINVGQDVPVLTSQAVSPVQNQGTSLFTNTIQNRNTGVTLDILATINPSGIVTLEIAQEVSAPVAPSANSAIQSPSFSTRTVSTQVTVQDGDTVAIGGIIQESYTDSSAGVPYLHRIPGIGLLFGSKSTSRERTELVVFLTPRVIYDTNQITDATEELKSKMRRVQRLMSKEKE